MDGEELPPGWASATLGDIVKPQRAKLTPDLASDLPFLGLEHIAADGLRPLGFGRFADMRSAASQFHPGDVLYGRLRPYLNKVWCADRVGAASAEFIVFPGHSDVDCHFLALLLHSGRFVAFARHAVSGDRPRIDVSEMAPFPIAVPPRAEQTRIATAVNALFEELDEAEAALARAREGVEQFRASLLHAACTGQLTAAWRRDNPPDETGADLLRRILAERRTAWESAERARLEARGTIPRGDAWKARYVEPVAPDLTDMPDLPEGWVWASLDMLIDRIEAGKNVSAIARPPEAGETGIVKVSAVTWGEFNEDASKTLYPGTEFDRAHVIAIGDFLISRANTLELVGAPVVVKSCGRRLVLSDKVLRFRFVADLRHWTEGVLKSSIGRNQIERYAQGAQLSMRNISQDNFRRMAIPMPPSPEGKMALELMQAGLEAMDVPNGDDPKLLRQSILHAAFTGRLVAQNPAEEPAVTLLARLGETAFPARRRRGRPVAKVPA